MGKETVSLSAARTGAYAFKRARRLHPSWAAVSANRAAAQSLLLLARIPFKKFPAGKLYLRTGGEPCCPLSAADRFPFWRHFKGSPVKNRGRCRKRCLRGRGRGCARPMCDQFSLYLPFKRLKAGFSAARLTARRRSLYNRSRRVRLRPVFCGVWKCVSAGKKAPFCEKIAEWRRLSLCTETKKEYNSMGQSVFGNGRSATEL